MQRRALIMISALMMSGGLAMTGPAQAAGGQKLSPATRQALRHACQADMKSLCPGIKPRGGALATCMAEHRAQVSVGCKAAMADAQMERRAARSMRQQKNHM